MQYNDELYWAVEITEPVLVDLVALCVVEGALAVDDIDTARWLAYTFIEVDRGPPPDNHHVRQVP